VAEDFLNRAQRDSLSQHQAGCGMPKIMEAHIWQSGLGEQRLEAVVKLVRIKRLT